ncbi:EamA family transporter [Actinomadura parmotrematis]|uniref:EamA family transporter n=1 Tax=Actinomadura parmotrematis TaxID=2864039 RepID=A0ABS7FX85_9ACTN|nr:EamA family transporter [Actinomadura parmotrematis]MBW8485038.1 EamA family transporter [Actinomadura parmotrematis]
MRLRHTLFAALIAAVWGFNFVPIKVGLDDFPPLLFAALRFAFAALPAVLFVRRPPVAWRWLWLVGLPLGVGQFGLLFIGMHLGMPAGLSSVVLQTQALFTFLFAGVLLRERITAMRAAGMAVAFSGVAVLGVVQSGGTSGPVLPFALCVAGAAMWALSNVAMRRMNETAAAPVDTFGFMVWMSLVPVLPLLALSLLFEGPGALPDAVRHVTWAGAGSLAYVTYASTLFGFGAWGWLMRRYPAGTVSMYSLLVPPFGLLSAAVVLRERVTAAQLAGAALIVAGVVIAGLRARPALVPDTPR